MVNVQNYVQEEEIAVDATNLKLGRLASYVAKNLMQGRRVVVVNAEKAVVTGNKKAILERYLMLVGRSQKRSIHRPSVWYPRTPNKLVWYAIVRMLPRKKAKGKMATHRLKVYVGIPEEYKNAKLVSFEDAKLTSIRNRSGKLIRYMTIEQISRELRGGGQK
ncbi:MAG: 50S ribosomal protein L13 [Nitrososphaerota archaeon]|nr:50S ribosomal protein L13 [Aigarchaeota archaeon]MDW8077090.1 50S ribosomal protein L13 [Nitrososphaerota archaeon]